ncbi:MAG: hypothetical protein OQK82_00535 [Candidatus Pacearchaeota archaeon]|nr:hypothetical protein [Candidatus Pacearchaeota archaeon]
MIPNKKAQLTIFIIVAILLVGGIIIYFTFKGGISQEQLPASLEPVYTSYLLCVEENLKTGIDVLETQGGYIEIPEFEAGSRHMPFSSQLFFLGNPIPYWYYVSGNNIPKEKIPSKSQMENELEKFVESKLRNCQFDTYYEQGFEITLGEPNTDISIENTEIIIDIDMDIQITKNNESALVNSHKITVTSNLKKLYDTALEIYQHEQNTLFLENYGIDTLRMYAPVDGVEITCAPLTWSADEIFNNIKQAIELNTQYLKLSSNEFILNNEKEKYYILDLESDADVRFLNMQDWPNSYDVEPSEGNVLIAEPVGTQEGLGILGFCYAPYHFIYNAKYPVLTQIMIEDELFQFPMAVVIQGNNPRESLNVQAVGISKSELCSNKNTPMQINVYDKNLNEINAEISYECLNAKCDIGTSPLTEDFPQCVNGYVQASAEGYKDTRYQHSTTQEGSLDIIMNKLYEKQITLNIDSQPYSGQAILTFKSDDYSRTIMYPDQRTIKLSEGQYEIQMHVYKNSTITLAETTTEKCIEIAQDGVAGVLGFTTEKCFDITIPSQVVSNALYAGGTQNYYITENQLTDSTQIKINSQSLGIPTSIDELQNNYILFDEQGLSIAFN